MSVKSRFEKAKRRFLKRKDVIESMQNHGALYAKCEYKKFKLINPHFCTTYVGYLGSIDVQKI